MHIQSGKEGVLCGYLGIGCRVCLHDVAILI